MAREVLDNEKLKKTKKTGEGVYSEEAGNVLKAQTPEEEYIVNRDVEINELKGKIEENEKAKKEIEKGFLSKEAEVEKEKKMIEEFSIKRLSEFLSRSELRTIKQGRKYRELDKIIEERKVDPLEDLINKIFEGIKDLTDEERLIIAQYLLNKQIILVNLSQFEAEDFSGYICRVGFYYTDFPEKMDFVGKVEENLSKLGIDKYMKYVGDSCYRLNDEFYGRTKEKMKEELGSDSEKEIKSEYDRLNEEGEKLEKKLESVEGRKHAVEKYGLPEKEAVSLYQWSEGLEGVCDEVYDKENHVCVVLSGYSDYSRGAGCEYGTVINIKRGKNTTKKAFKYRDAYDYRNDNPRYNYKKIKSVKVDGNTVEVTVSNGKSSDTYTFDIAYKEIKRGTESVDNEEFKEGIKRVEEELIKENTKDKKYPASYNLALRKVPGAFSHEGMNLDSELSYEEAKIVYEDIDPDSGEAHVTILMQKDASGDMGRQYGLIKYIVTPEGATAVDEYFYWELNMMEGNVDKEKMDEFNNR